MLKKPSLRGHGPAEVTAVTEGGQKVRKLGTGTAEIHAPWQRDRRGESQDSEGRKEGPSCPEAVTQRWACFKAC